MGSVKMFDVVYVDLSDRKNGNIGSEQDGVRPCVVIQNDVGNLYSPTVVVIPLTTSIKKVYLPTHYVIHKTQNNGLLADSMMLGEALRSVDKSRIKQWVGHLDGNTQKGALSVFIAVATGQRESPLQIA